MTPLPKSLVSPTGIYRTKEADQSCISSITDNSHFHFNANDNNSTNFSHPSRIRLCYCQDLELFGRDEEVHILKQTLNRVVSSSNTHSECVWVRGASGIGKTVLVETSLREYAVKSLGACFIKGKFDQLMGSRTQEPYSALSAALTDLIDLIVQQQDRTNWKERITKMKEELAKFTNLDFHVLLGHLIPNIDKLIGPPPSAMSATSNFPLLSPSSEFFFSRNDQHSTRIKQDDGLLFQTAFQKFIRVVAATITPIVLVLDDVQWIDPGSIPLLRALLKDTESERILFVGTFREQQPGDFEQFRNNLFEGNNNHHHHQQQQLLQLGKPNKEDNEISSCRLLASHEIQLESLPPNAVQGIVASLFHRYQTWNDQESSNSEDAQIMKLSEVVYKRTLGNPYFIIEFMDNLKSQNMLDWEKPLSSEQVELIQSETSCTTNVVEFLLENKIQRIPSNCQQLLQIASCLGHTFHHDLVCEIVHSLESEDRSDAVGTVTAQAGDTQTRLLLQLATEEGLIEPVGVERVSKFCHDKIQMAFSRHLAGNQSELIHFRIGRCVLNLISAQESQEEANHLLFLATDQMNRASGLIHSEEDSVAIVKLNLRSGECAISKSAFFTAVDFFRMAVSLLPPNSWNNYYGLFARAHQRLCDCEFLCGNFEECESTAEIVLAHAVREEDKNTAYRCIVQALEAQGKTDEAIELGFRILRSVFGMKFGPSPKINLDFYKCRKLLKQKTTVQILTRPGMTDPKLLATMKMLRVVAGISTKKRRHLITWKCNDKMVLLSLRHGVCPESAEAFASFGVSEAYCRNVGNAHRMGQLTMSTLEQLGNSCIGRAKAMIQSQLACFHHLQPIARSIVVFERAFKEASAAREAKCMVEAAGLYMNLSIITGAHLPTLETQMRSIGASQARLYKDRSFEMTVFPQWQYALNMIDCETREPVELSGDVMDETSFLEYSKEHESFAIMPIFWALKIQLSVHFGRFHNRMVEQCINRLSLAKYKDDSTLYWRINVYHIRLYVGIALIHIAKTRPGRYKSRAKRVMRQTWNQAQKRNPNATLVYYILRAIYLSGEKRAEHQDIFRMFSMAIGLAEEQKFFTGLGLACEYAAYYAHSVGQPNKASWYALAALDIYDNKMGAYRLVDYLETKFGFMGLDLGQHQAAENANESSRINFSSAPTRS